MSFNDIITTVPKFLIDNFSYFPLKILVSLSCWFFLLKLKRNKNRDNPENYFKIIVGSYIVLI